MKEEKSEYDLKAEQFLKETETEFKAKFLKNGLYFYDDKEPRGVYKITLKRGSQKWTFKFGQSISDTGKEPTPYEVLASITKYNPEDFKEFCSSYGYDEDSRKAYKIYKAVVKEWEKVSNLFNSEELEKLQDIN